MDWNLDKNEVRVLGTLLEKEVTTPDYYPMTLNSLVAACNQKTNRDPVMQLAEEDVLIAIDHLKEKRLVWQRTVAGSRVPKYEHNLRSFYPFNSQQSAIVCILMLRGPQTIGELRLRSERLCTFSSLEEVEHAAGVLLKHELGPFIQELPRQPGQKENRFVELFSDGVYVKEASLAQLQEAGESIPLGVGQGKGSRIDVLEQQVAFLTEELHTLREEVALVKKMLE